MKFTEITYEKITAEIELFLKKAYNKSGILFSPASPYGQILTVSKELFQLSLLNLKNIVKQFDITDARNRNKKMVQFEAVVAGHNPTRAVSATGTLRLALKSTTDIEKDIPGGKISILNRSNIKNKTNGLDYLIDLGGKDKVTYQLTNGTQFFLNIIQGKESKSTFTGTGEINQTFNLTVPGNKDVENFNVIVTVDGEVWDVKKHLYYMLPDEKACVIRTGINGGIDIIFGNSGFGLVPPIASEIIVKYIETDGSIGSIFRRTSNDWKFVDEAIDGYGNSLDVTQYFDIFIYTDINFGADAESIQFTKNILPLTTNDVLALPQHYAYHIKRLGVFSHVNAYEKDGVINIVATPNIKLFKNQNKNYFTIDKAAFILDTYEKSKVDKYLKSSGTIQLTRKYRITSPELAYYVMNIFVVTYDDAVDDNVNSEIYDVISEYFLDFQRIDRVPILDITKRLGAIRDIDSLDISFVSKNNEDYHKKFIITRNNQIDSFPGTVGIKPLLLANAAVSNQASPLFNNDIDKKGYDPNATIGLDPILGDIIFEPHQIPIIRGGWADRNGLFFNEVPSSDGFSSVNIIKKGTTIRKNLIG